MNQLTRASLRYHGRRYLATGIGVAIAVAFVLATIVFGQGMGLAMEQMILGRTVGADTIVTYYNPSIGVDEDEEAAAGEEDESGTASEAGTTGEAANSATAGSAETSEGGEAGAATTKSIFQEIVAGLESVDGVESVYPTGGNYFEIYYGEKTTSGAQPYVSTMPPDGLSTPVTITAGSAPTSGNEILLSDQLAEELGVEVGAEVRAYGTSDIYGNAIETAETGAGGDTFTVSGIFKERKASSITAEAPIAAYVSLDGMSRFNPDFIPDFYLVIGEGEMTNEDQDQLTEAIRSMMLENGWVVDEEEATNAATAGHKNEEDLHAILGLSTLAITAMMLVFPLITSIVAIIIVSSTFQVVVKQRQRELALLRCVGATSKQVKRMILGESAMVGLVGSILGVIIGWFVGAAVLVGTGITVTYGEALTVTSPFAAVISLVVGVVFTVLAGLRPAGLAGRSRPIEALSRSATSGMDASKSRRLQGIISGIIFAGSLAAAIYWVSTADPADSNESVKVFGYVVLACAIGAISGTLFVAAILPGLTSGMGKLSSSTIWQIAASNTGRNPRRTAATGVSVFIGVALISMMLVGAQSVRYTVQESVDATAPVDLVVGNVESPVLRSDLVQGMQSVAGIEASQTLVGTRAEVSIRDTSVPRTSEDDMAEWALSTISSAAVVSGDDLGEVVRGSYTPPTDDQIVVPSWMIYVEDRGNLVAEVCVDDNCRELEIVTSSVGDNLMVDGTTTVLYYVVVSEATLAELSQNTDTLGVVMKLSNPDEYQDTLAYLNEVSSALSYGGSIAIRASVITAIDQVLLVIVVLLLVSVLVALVGVSNTLSLSVVERTQENGLLRAVGMSKRQMMRMLTIESVLMALVAVILGVAVGIGFGLIGLYALPLGVTPQVQMPWIYLGIVVIVAFIAAVLASLLPGYRASRVSPVEALASL